MTVLQQQELGIVSCIIQKKKNLTNKDLTKKVTICERKDMQATATRYAKNVIKSSSYFILENTDDPRYELAEEYHPPDDEIFPPSWAQRQGRGKLYGETYIDQYQEDLEEMFKEGKEKIGRAHV